MKISIGTLSVYSSRSWIVWVDVAVAHFNSSVHLRKILKLTVSPASCNISIASETRFSSNGWPLIAKTRSPTWSAPVLNWSLEIHIYHPSKTSWTHLSANPPLVNWDIIIGSDRSSTPAIVIPNGPFFLLNSTE